MTQVYSPETTLAKAQSFLRNNEINSVINCISEFILNTKKRNWTVYHEEIIYILIECTIQKNNLDKLREGLNFYRTIAQQQNLFSFIEVVMKVKQLVEGKFQAASKNLKDLKNDLQDLDSDDLMSLANVYDISPEQKEMENFVSTQKFIWKTYKILLDFTKTNSKLLKQYSEILKAAFNFCRENKRKNEFKRLCDSVRGYLQTLIKTENRQLGLQNQVRLSNPDVLKRLIQIRLFVLDTATYLETWQEAFKTAEDLVFLFEKYERNDPQTEKTNKIPYTIKADFIKNVKKILWVSEYYLYYAYASILEREYLMKMKKKGLQDKQINLKVDEKELNDYIVLAVLSTPSRNLYTNFTKIEDRNSFDDKSNEAETCSRMMKLLNLNYVPSKKSLHNYIESNRIVDESSEEIKNLYNLLEKEKNPIIASRNSLEILNSLQNNKAYQQFTKLVQNNLVLKTLLALSVIYKTITFERLEKLFKVPFANFENIIIENSRDGIINCDIDFKKNLIHFKNQESIRTELTTKFKNTLKEISEVSLNILSKDKNSVVNKIQKLINQELETYNNNSLTLIEKSNKILKEKMSEIYQFINAKDLYISQKKAQKAEEKQRKIFEEEMRIKTEKQILKDEKKKKEFENQLKKYLIDRIRLFTNVIVVKEKKYHIDDLLKNLDKVSDTDLVSALEEEEILFKTKKEKKFKELAKENDYLVRAVRKKDNRAYLELMDEENRYYQEQFDKEKAQEIERTRELSETIESIQDFTESYFRNVLEERTEIFEDNLEKYKADLKQKLESDIREKVNKHFKKYIEFFRENLKKEQGYNIKFTTNYFKKDKDEPKKRGELFRKDDSAAKGPIVIQRGALFQRGATEEAKQDLSGPISFARSSKAQAPTKPPATVTPAVTGFVKGAMLQKQAEEVTSTSTSTPATTGFIKGAMFQRQTEEVASSDKKGEDVIRPSFTNQIKTDNPKRIEAKPEIKSDGRSGWGRGPIKTEEPKPIEMKPVITRNIPVKTEEVKKDLGGFQRGANVVQKKEEPKITRGTGTAEPKKDFSRAGVTEKPKEEEKTAKKPEPKQQGGWRK